MMKNRWLLMQATMVGLVIVASASASAVYTEGFESYGNLVQFNALGPDWYAMPDGTNDASPATEWGVGVAGPLSGPNNVGIQQGSRPARWDKHRFNWNNPTLTSVVEGIDFETNWDTASLRPYRNRYLGWMVNSGTSLANGDVFGVKLEGDTSGNLFLQAAFRNAGNTSQNPTLATLTFGQWDYETFYRLRVAYTKTVGGGVQMDATVTKLDKLTGLPDPTPVATGSFNTDTYNTGRSASQRINTAQYTGPMWMSFTNFNDAAGNADNVYLELVPEPASMVLLVAGGGLLLLLRRRG